MNEDANGNDRQKCVGADGTAVKVQTSIRSLDERTEFGRSIVMETKGDVQMTDDGNTNRANKRHDLHTPESRLEEVKAVDDDLLEPEQRFELKSGRRESSNVGDQ
jgi:hypothetical protein